LGVEGRLAEDLSKPAGFSQELFEHCVAVWRFLGNQGGQVKVNDLAEAEQEVARFKEGGFQVAPFQLRDPPYEYETGGVSRFQCRGKKA
jgi:hypothetical protein